MCVSVSIYVHTCVIYTCGGQSGLACSGDLLGYLPGYESSLSLF